MGWIGHKADRMAERDNVLLFWPWLLLLVADAAWDGIQHVGYTFSRLTDASRNRVLDADGAGDRQGRSSQ